AHLRAGGKVEELPFTELVEPQPHSVGIATIDEIDAVAQPAGRDRADGNRTPQNLRFFRDLVTVRTRNPIAAGTAASERAFELFHRKAPISVIRRHLTGDSSRPASSPRLDLRAVHRRLGSSHPGRIPS